MLDLCKLVVRPTLHIILQAPYYDWGFDMVPKFKYLISKQVIGFFICHILSVRCEAAHARGPALRDTGRPDQRSKSHRCSSQRAVVQDPRAGGLRVRKHQRLSTGETISCEIGIAVSYDHSLRSERHINVLVTCFCWNMICPARESKKLCWDILTRWKMQANMEYPLDQSLVKRKHAGWRIVLETGSLMDSFWWTLGFACRVHSGSWHLQADHKANESQKTFRVWKCLPSFRLLFQTKRNTLGIVFQQHILEKPLPYCIRWVDKPFTS